MKISVEEQINDYEPEAGEWFRVKGSTEPMMRILPHNVNLGLHVRSQTIAFVNCYGDVGFFGKSELYLEPLKIKGGELVLVPA